MAIESGYAGAVTYFYIYVNIPNCFVRWRLSQMWFFPARQLIQLVLFWQEVRNFINIQILLSKQHKSFQLRPKRNNAQDTWLDEIIDLEQRIASFILRYKQCWPHAIWLVHVVSSKNHILNFLDIPLGNSACGICSVKHDNLFLVLQKFDIMKNDSTFWK